MNWHIIAALVLIVGSWCQGQSIWTGAGAGNWSDASDWIGGVPNAVNAQATLNASAASTFITMDQPAIVGQLTINSGPWLYMIQGNSPIILDSDSGPAQLNNLSGQNLILAPVSLENTTTITVSAGSSLAISSDFSSDGMSLTYTGGGTLNLPYVRAGSLNIQQGVVSMFENGSNNAISVLNSLNISPGQTLDLADNSLIVNYIGPSPLANITGAIASAFDGGKWDKPGLTSRDAATTPGAALGVGDANVLGITNFQGQFVSTAVLVKYTWYGDANLDGKVDGADLALMQQGELQHLSGWTNGDFNYDGRINSDDFALLQLGLSLQGATDSQTPEPAAGLIALVILLPRRRRTLK